MDKVYSLLRNNEKSGPYSLDEMVQKELNMVNDLVWVEGKSSNWSTPLEAETLQPFLVKTNQSQETESTVPETSGPASNQATPPSIEMPPVQKVIMSKYVYVSLPFNFSPSTTVLQEPSPASKLEQKAEELRKRAMAFSRETPVPAVNPITPKQTIPGRTLADLQEEYDSWVHKKKSQKKQRLVMTILASPFVAMAVFAGGYFIAQYHYQTKSPQHKDITIRENTNRPIIQPVAEEPVLEQPKTVLSESTSQETVSQENITAIPGSEATAEPVVESLNEVKDNAPALPVSKKKVPVKARKQPGPKIAVVEAKLNEEEKRITEAPPVENNSGVSDANKQDEPVIQQSEKKKTLGQKLKNLFKKKKGKKGDEQDLAEPQVGSSASGSSE